MSEINDQGQAVYVYYLTMGRWAPVTTILDSQSGGLNRVAGETGGMETEIAFFWVSPCHLALSGEKLLSRTINPDFF